MGVDPDSVARTVLFLAPLSQTLTVGGQYADQTSVVLRDVSNVVLVDVHQGRTDELGGPGFYEIAALRKDLNAVILTVRH